jgi:hypothetical protein
MNPATRRTDDLLAVAARDCRADFGIAEPRDSTEDLKGETGMPKVLPPPHLD